MIPTPFAHGRHALMDAGRGFLWLPVAFAFVIGMFGSPEIPAVANAS